MVALETPICDFGWNAPEFDLIGTDGKNYQYGDIKGPNGTLVMFICNHCPYVKSVIGRIVEDCNLIKDTINAAKKAAPVVEVKKVSEKKEKSDKTKTVAEIDRDKLEKKFSPKKETKKN